MQQQPFRYSDSARPLFGSSEAEQIHLRVVPVERAAEYRQLVVVVAVAVAVNRSSVLP